MSQTPQDADLDKAFEALKTYKTGDDPAPVQGPIDKAVMAVQGNMANRAALERRIAATLTPAYSYVARSFVCRQLALIGTQASVPALAPLVLEEELSVHARNALERIAGEESAKALRDALGQAKGRTRIGVINSVVARRDAASTRVLIKILGEDQDSAAAAAKALGEIGTAEAAKALTAELWDIKKKTPETKNIMIFPEQGTPFEEIVQTMDAAREMPSILDAKKKVPLFTRPVLSELVTDDDKPREEP